MLDGTRIPPVDIETLPDDIREVLEEQRKLRGEPLYPYLFYARNNVLQSADIWAYESYKPMLSRIIAPCGHVKRNGASFFV